MLGVYAIVKVADYGWLSAHTLGFGAAAVGLLAIFVAVESRVSKPMFPLRIMRVPGLTGSSVVRGFVGTGMYSTFLLGVLYLQHVHGYGALADRPRLPAAHAAHRPVLAWGDRSADAPVRDHTGGASPAA